jgi:hypothetical protein
VWAVYVLTSVVSYRLKVVLRDAHIRFVNFMHVDLLQVFHSFCILHSCIVLMLCFNVMCILLYYTSSSHCTRWGEVESCLERCSHTICQLYAC